MAYGYDPHLAEILRSVQGRLNAPNPGPDYAGMLRATQQRLGPQGPGMGFELGPTGPLQTPSVPNFRLGPASPLQTPRGSVGAGPSGMFDVPTGLKPVLESAPPTRYADIRQSMFGPRLTDHVGASTWNSVAPSEFTPGTINPNVSSIPQSVMAPSELELAGLRSGQGALPTWMGSANTAGTAEQSFLQGLRSNAFLKNTAPEAMAEGMGAAPALTGAAKYAEYGKMGVKGLGKGLGGLAISTVGNSLADQLPMDSNARPGIRAMSNVGGAMFALPAIGGGLAATAAVPGVGIAEALSRGSAGNEVINAGRNASDNTLANLVTNAIPLLQAEQIGSKLSGLFGGTNDNAAIDMNNRTNDTVFDVLGGGNSNASQAAAPTITPEQRLAQSSPDALTKYASDYGLSDAMTQKLLKNYNQEMVVAKHQGYVTLPVDKDGMVDGTTKAEEYPGAKKVTDAKGNATWVTTNPADIQQAVYERAAQLVPTLGASQDQEEEFFRKQAVMQAQLEQVLPQLYNPAIWGSDPTAQTLAMAESRAIPSRYVQAQALQAQQGYDNQVAQAMQQQQLAQQYPDLFGKKSSSSQPATLDAAIQNG